MNSESQQSKNLKNQVNLDGIVLVISSDLQRAIDSAEYTFAGIKKILHGPRLRECNYGDLDGTDSGLVIDEDHISTLFPNGESLKDAEARMRDFCEYLLKKLR